IRRHRSSTLFPYTTLFRSHVDEAVVKVLVVLRAGAALGVVLHAESRQRAVTETLDRAVVQVALRDVEVAGRDRRRVDLELVVLRSEEHTSELQSRGHLVCR